MRIFSYINIYKYIILYSADFENKYLNVIRKRN